MAASRCCLQHFQLERTVADGATSVKLPCEVAAARGLVADMHGDESNNLLLPYTETLAFEAQRLGLQARVTGSDCTSMHIMDTTA